MCTEIKKKIEQYGKCKLFEKELKEQLSTLSKDIKDYMLAHNSTVDESDSFEVTLQTKTTETVDKEAMLKILKEDWAEHNGSMQCPYIKTAEYVDEDELEARAYRGEISKEVLLKLDKCRKITKTKALIYKERTT